MNDQWRVVFRWSDGAAEDVAPTDYHWHVVAAVGERLRGGGQTQATVAGRRLGGTDAAALAEAQAGYERAWAERLREGRLQDPPRTLAVRDLVAGSSFSVTAAQAGGRWTVWGRGGWSHFAGSADGGALQVAGDVVTASAGADYEQGAVLAGLALAYSSGGGTYEHGSDRSGSVVGSLLSVHPYVRLALHERLAVWGLFGYGVDGQLTLEDAVAGRMETGTGLLLGAFGVDGLLLAAAHSGGLELAARADGLLLRMSSAAAAGLAASAADVSRWRLLLEASYAGVPLFGGVLTPALAVGGRYDGGAAESGVGLVLSGRLSYALPAWGLTLSAAGAGLLVHEADGLREWGAGGALRFDPGAPGRGLALRVAPSWGVAGSGAAGPRRRAHLAPGHPPAPAARPRPEPASHPPRPRCRRRPTHPHPRRIAALVSRRPAGFRVRGPKLRVARDPRASPRPNGSARRPPLRASARGVRLDSVDRRLLRRRLGEHEIRAIEPCGVTGVLIVIVSQPDGAAAVIAEVDEGVVSVRGDGQVRHAGDGAEGGQVDRVCALVEVGDRVIAVIGAEHEGVVATVSGQRIVTGPAGQRVVAARTQQTVVAVVSLVPVEHEVVRAQVGFRDVLEPDGAPAVVAEVDHHVIAVRRDRQIGNAADLGKLSQIDQIRAVREVGDRVVAVAALETEGVVAGAAGQRVVTGAASQPVVVGAAVQRVRARAADEGVVAAASGEGVVAVVANDIVVVGAAVEGVVTGPAYENVVALAAVDKVVAVVPEQPVVAFASYDRIVAAAGKDQVVARAGVNRFAVVGPEQHFGSVSARDLVFVVCHVICHGAFPRLQRTQNAARRTITVPIAVPNMADKRDRCKPDCGALREHLSGPFVSEIAQIKQTKSAEFASVQKPSDVRIGEHLPDILLE